MPLLLSGEIPGRFQGPARIPNQLQQVQIDMVCNRSKIVLMAWVLLGFVVLSSTADAQASDPRDVMLVLDNSGSMKKNDPQFLTKAAVEQFIERLDESTRVGVVIFDQKVRLAEPLTELTAEGRTKILGSLDLIDYRGQLTDSPSGVERAIYELRNGAREDSRKLIIFMTDGIVDTGDAALDVEKTRWLRTELADGAAEAQIRIFSIAFTENADFFLTQSLAQKTNGEYFRAPAPENLAAVFENINAAIEREPEPEPVEPEPVPVVEAETEPESAPIPEPAPPVQPPLPAPPPATIIPGVNDNIVFIAASAFILFGLVVIVLLLRRKSTTEGTGKGAGYVPKAYLKDTNGITADPAYEIGAKPVMLGRVAGNDANLEYIVVNQSTVGRRHALIEYRDFSFWIADQGSVNGTYVNGQRIDAATHLKHGDKIKLHNFEFDFDIPELADSGQTVFSNPAADEDIGEKTVIASAPAVLAEMDQSIGDETAEVSEGALTADETNPPLVPEEIPEPDEDFSALFETQEEESGVAAQVEESLEEFIPDEPESEPDDDIQTVEPLLVLGDDDDEFDDDFGKPEGFDEDEFPEEEQDVAALSENTASDSESDAESEAEEAAPSQDELDARFEQMFDEDVDSTEEPGETGFNELETVVRDEPEVVADFNEGDTIVSDAETLADGGTEDDDDLDTFIETSTFQAKIPVIDSEDPTMTPEMVGQADVEMTLDDDDSAGDDEADLSLDDFIDSTVLDDDDEDATVMLPEDEPVDDDPDRTLMPSQVDDKPRER